MTLSGGNIKEINERQYEFYHLPTKRALRLLMKLSKILGGALAKGFSGKKEGAGILDSDIEIGDMVEALVSKLDETTVLGIIDDLLKNIHIENTEAPGNYMPSNLERDFPAQKLGDLFLVIKEALIFNYGSFFAEAFGAVKSTKAAATTKAD